MITHLHQSCRLACVYHSHGMHTFQFVPCPMRTATRRSSTLDRIQEDSRPNPWAMTDADIAVYDKAFVKLDKDKDGYISLHGTR